MDAKMLQELCQTIDQLRRKLITLNGDDPDDHSSYCLYPPATQQAIADAEMRSGHTFPASFRTFLLLHNGWLGFWPDWSLVGVGHEQMDEDIETNLGYLPDVAGEARQLGLPDREKSDPNVIQITNHPIVATDFNGSFIVADTNRLGPDGDPELAWVSYLMHVERRWRCLQALLEEAIEDTRSEIEQRES